MRDYKIAYHTTCTIGRRISADVLLIALLLSTIAAVLLSGLHVIDYVFRTDWVRPWFNWFYLCLFPWIYMGTGMFREAWLKQYHEQWREQLSSIGNRYYLSKCKTPAKHKMYHVAGNECPCLPPERNR